jgi:uncharacterized protein
MSDTTVQLLGTACGLAAVADSGAASPSVGGNFDFFPLMQVMTPDNKIDNVRGELQITMEKAPMSHVPHEIPTEFPEYKDRIHDLKTTDGHFSRLYDEYHDINREIHRAEAAGLNISDEHYEELKKKRMTLKDEIFEMLKG